MQVDSLEQPHVCFPLQTLYSFDRVGQANHRQRVHDPRREHRVPDEFDYRPRCPGFGQRRVDRQTVVDHLLLLNGGFTFWR